MTSTTDPSSAPFRFTPEARPDSRASAAFAPPTPPGLEAVPGVSSHRIGGIVRASFPMAGALPPAVACVPPAAARDPPRAASEPPNATFGGSNGGFGPSEGPPEATDARPEAPAAAADPTVPSPGNRTTP
ncbi:MAG: hypothetical protein BroJett004_21380 [Planctomycetota bacterium]|nr:MAG: hypothetical protein BroJett004_21380 [Planctomycetota bacterium]